MIALNTGMVLNFGGRGGKVWISSIDAKDPTYRGDTIFIPIDRLEEVIEQLRAQVK